MVREPQESSSDSDQSLVGLDRRRVLAGLAGVGTVGLAGCSEDDPQTTDVPSTAEPQPTETMTEENTEQPTGTDDETEETEDGGLDEVDEYPPGYSHEGVDDVTSAFAPLFQGLVTENFTYTWEDVFRGNGDEVTWRRKATYKRNPDSGRSSIDYDEEGFEDNTTRSAYSEGSTVYENGEETEFDSESDAISDISVKIIQMADYLLSRFNYHARGQQDNGDIIYDIEGIAEPGPVPMEEDDEITGFLQLREDGLPVIVNIQIEGSDRSAVYTKSVEITDFGSTTIDG